MPPVALLAHLPAQAEGALFELLDKGPLGLVAILMVAIWRLWAYKETQFEKMREAFKLDYDKIREANTALLIETKGVIQESNELSRRIVELMQRDRE